MKKLDLKALELAGMILCAIVDLAIIAAAVFLYIHTGHGAWMALIYTGLLREKTSRVEESGDTFRLLSTAVLHFREV